MLSSLPADAGIGLKPEFFADLKPHITKGLWFEVHAENYFIEGGPRLESLKTLAQQVPLSVHGVGASLSSPEPVCPKHLQNIKQLCDSMPVASFSEHLAWSSLEGAYFSNLMPVPRTRKSLAYTADNINRVQDIIQRPILVENPSNYIELSSHFSEPEFMMELTNITGCGILLDVNNLYISATNINMAVDNYIDVLDLDVVGEIHVAGHTQDPHVSNFLIDSHDCPVSPSVWSLLSKILKHSGPKPILIERDSNLPPLSALMQERQFASDLIKEVCGQPASE